MYLENFSSLLYSSSIFYLLGLLLLFFVFKFHIFSSRSSERSYSILTSFWFQVLAGFYFVLFGAVFIGLYRPNFLSFNPIPSILVTLIVSLFIGGIFFFLFRQGMIFLFKYKNNSFKYLHKIKYGVFILIIFLTSFIFSFQAVSTVNSNRYSIDSQSVTLSSDFTEMAYLVFHNNNPYVVIRNLQHHNNVTIFSLTDLPCTDFFNSSPCTIHLNSDSLLRFFIDKNILLIIGSISIPSYLFYISQQKLVQIFNLYPYQLFNHYFWGDYYYLYLSNPNVMFISRIFNYPNISDTGLIYFYSLTPQNPLHISQQLIVTHISVNNTIPGIIRTSSIDYSFSQDLSKLVYLYVGTSDVQLNFYSISNNQTNLLANYSINIIQQNLFHNVQFIKWSSDYSTFFYAVYNGTDTMIYAFNFSNSSTSLVCTFLDEDYSHNIITVDDSESFLVTNIPFAIYSTGKQITLLKTLKTTDNHLIIVPTIGYQNYFGNSLWDAKGTKFVQISRAGAIYFSSYDYTSNTITGPTLIDSNITPTDTNNFTTVVLIYLFIILFFFVLLLDFWKVV